jgi:hypothetical protein
MTTLHEVKSWPEFFAPVAKGVKTFELRRDDRGYRIGDLIRLREWEPERQEYTGREITKRIVYIMKGVGPGGVEPYRGIFTDYAILQLADCLATYTFE